jgi:hypothetical protein
MASTTQPRYRQASLTSPRGEFRAGSLAFQNARAERGDRQGGPRTLPPGGKYQAKLILQARVGCIKRFFCLHWLLRPANRASVGFLPSFAVRHGRLAVSIELPAFHLPRVAVRPSWRVRASDLDNLCSMIETEATPAALGPFISPRVVTHRQDFSKPGIHAEDRSHWTTTVESAPGASPRFLLCII